MSGVLPPDVIGTGDIASGNLTRFSFVAPNDLWIVEAIVGFFVDYCNAGTWYQVGTATPDQAAEYMQRIYNSLGVDMATIGAIVPFAGGILPAGWLVCDGTSLIRSAYPDLFAAIGTVWGAADSSHFNIPDLRGRTLVGQGFAGSGTTYNLGTTGGEEAHTLITSETPSHSHTDTGHSHTTGNSLLLGTSVPPPLDALGPNPLPAFTGSGSANLTSTGGDGPHNNMQPFAVVNYAIIAL